MSTKDYFKRYYSKHSEKRKQSSSDYNRNMKIAVHALLGNECSVCGVADFRVLQIDHVNGGGTTEKRSTTKHYYKMILGNIARGSKEYQLLCANCNWIKKYENKETR